LKLYSFEYQLQEEEEKWMSAIESLKKYKYVNGSYYVNNALKKGEKILAEGAQGSMLDIDFGTYPFVTSSNTITAAVCTGLGVSPHKIGEVYGITKAYCTRVGSGPFPTEEDNEVGERLRQLGGEFGATTGRPRRCGWIDLPALQYTCMLNGVTKLIITKADILNSFEEFGVCTDYKIDNTLTREIPFDIIDKVIEPQFTSFKSWGEIPNIQELPKALEDYVRFLEDYLETTVAFVSVGPEREKLIDLYNHNLIA
jgi:adenylosuccinate synthase